MTVLIFEVDRVLQDTFENFEPAPMLPLVHGSLAAVVLRGGELHLPDLEVRVDMPQTRSGSDWVHAPELLVAGRDRRWPARIVTECGHVLDAWYLSAEYLGRVENRPVVELVVPASDRAKVLRPFELSELGLGDPSASDGH